MAAGAGAYVTYPFDDLLRIVALESHRQNCAVIGEDLGTVPAGFREKMWSANVLSYRVLVFERRRDGDFAPPDDYPPLAAATVATHDIATLKGFWCGRDIEWRRHLNLYPDAAAAETEAAERSRDRRLLLKALVQEELLAPADADRLLPQNGEPVYWTELADAVLTYMARSRARLMLIQLEEVLGESEQANLPGTIDTHPNWRRRTSLGLGETIAGADFQRITALITKGRQHSARGAAPRARGSPHGWRKKL
jgi:4-alpha-glucanotransferase